MLTAHLSVAVKKVTAAFAFYHGHGRDRFDDKRFRRMLKVFHDCVKSFFCSHHDDHDIGGQGSDFAGEQGCAGHIGIKKDIGGRSLVNPSRAAWKSVIGVTLYPHSLSMNYRRSREAGSGSMSTKVSLFMTIPGHLYQCYNPGQESDQNLFSDGL